MKHRIVITRQAENDIEQLYLRTLKHAPMTAPRWYAKLSKAIHSLETLPDRCPLSPEGELYSLPLLQLIYGKRHSAIRILFVIEGDQVTIIHCVRGSRDHLSRDDIDI